MKPPSTFWLRLVLMGTLGCISGAVADEPPLFFYPLAHRSVGGQVLASPQTIDVAQITNKVPLPANASGIVLIVYWSTLCPEENRCNFDLIDRTLAYWEARGKKLVLDVVATGFPISTDAGVQDPAPSDLHVRTFQAPAWLLASDQKPIQWTMADFRDDRFLAAVARLVGSLRRYDGNRTIAQIRIATGAMGEDNPLIGPVMASAAGISERDWLAYTQKITAVYFAAFHKTELEFDIGRLGWMAVRGSQSERQAVDLFIGDLLAHRVLLAFDGITSDSLAQLLHPSMHDGLAQCLEYLREYQARGGRIGLEAARHAGAPAMQDVSAIAEAITMLHPNRLVLFSDPPGRDGPLVRLLSALGYK